MTLDELVKDYLQIHHQIALRARLRGISSTLAEINYVVSPLLQPVDACYFHPANYYAERHDSYDCGNEDDLPLTAK
jgi:hypothetical protein